MFLAGKLGISVFVNLFFKIVLLDNISHTSTLLYFKPKLSNENFRVNFKL